MVDLDLTTHLYLFCSCRRDLFRSRPEQPARCGGGCCRCCLPFGARASLPRRSRRCEEGRCAQQGTAQQGCRALEAFLAPAAGDPNAPSLPAPIPFTTFQALEKTSDPEFMEAVIDYAEAFRGAKDLVKLAKLTKSTVIVDKKAPAVKVEELRRRALNLSSAKEHAERAAAESSAPALPSRRQSRT